MSQILSPILCAGMGYIMGTVNPALLISRAKNVDLRKGGTGNLGASNVFMHFGEKFGFLVIFIDMFKAWLAVMLAKRFYVGLTFAGALAGSSAMLGHMFPFYTKDKRGGKGLACLGGTILGLNAGLFWFLLIFCGIMAIILNYGITLTFMAGGLFPILYGITTKNVFNFLFPALACGIMLYKHRENLTRIKNGQEKKVRDVMGKAIRRYLHKD